GPSSAQLAPRRRLSTIITTPTRKTPAATSASTIRCVTRAAQGSLLRREAGFLHQRLVLLLVLLQEPDEVVSGEVLAVQRLPGDVFLPLGRLADLLQHVRVEGCLLLAGTRGQEEAAQHLVLDVVAGVLAGGNVRPRLVG